MADSTRTIETWAQYLERLEEPDSILHAFLRYGYSKDTALIAMALEKIHSELVDPEDEDDTWKAD